MQAAVVTPQFLTKEQVACQLFVSYKTVENLVKIGELKAIKHGRCIRFLPEDVNNYLKSKLELKNS